MSCVSNVFERFYGLFGIHNVSLMCPVSSTPGTNAFSVLISPVNTYIVLQCNFSLNKFSFCTVLFKRIRIYITRALILYICSGSTESIFFGVRALHSFYDLHTLYCVR